MPKIIKSGVNYIPDIPDQINSDWLAEEGSEGFIENKPSLTLGSDYDQSGVVIGAKESNIASGSYSIAEGEDTKATGLRAHAEGYMTEASGSNSHAEGNATKATSVNSHAEGVGTVTPNLMGAHVQGRYNSTTNNSNLIDIVGYGSNASNRKNISALTTDGRLILSGGVTIGADDKSQGGYTIPVPADFEYGQKYVLSFDPDNESVVWEPLDQNLNTNYYEKYNGYDGGPFTIYDGTAEPSAGLGKTGDIYFKHN